MTVQSLSSEDELYAYVRSYEEPLPVAATSVTPAVPPGLLACLPVRLQVYVFVGFNVGEAVEALAPYLQPAKARCGDKPFLAVYGGDPAHVATIGADAVPVLRVMAVVRAAKARYGCHVLAIQAAGSPEAWTDAVFVCEEQHEVVHRNEGGLLVEQRQVLYGGVRDGKPVGGARYYMGDVFYGRPCEGQQGRVRLTFFLGGGAIAAEELAYADSQGAPWVYLPCRLLAACMTAFPSLPPAHAAKGCSTALSGHPASNAEPAPQPGRWLDRDADAALNLQLTGASGSGQHDQGQGQAVKKVIAERRQVIKATFRGLVVAARPDLSPAQVDAVVAEVNKRMTMGSKQCCLAAILGLAVLLQSFLGQPTPGFPAASPAPGPPPPPDPACPPYSHPRLPPRTSPRSAAAPAQLPPPVQLNILDPQLLVQIRDAMELITKASVQEHLMRGPQHRGIRLLPGEVAVFEQPSSAWTVAMLKQLDEEHVRGDNNSLNANATNIITSIQDFYRHPGRFIRWWCKAVGVVEEGFSRAMKKHFPQLVLGRLDYSLPDRQHKWRLPPNSVLRQPRWREEVVKHRRLLGLAATWREGQDSIGKRGAGRLPREKRVRYVLFVNRSLEGWQAAHDTCPRPFTMLPMVGVRARHFVIDDRVLHGLLTDLGMTNLTQQQIDADSLPHWQKFIQYSQLQNSGWEFARRVETDGVSISVHFVRSQAVTEPVELPFIGRKLTATSDYDPTTHIAVGVDPGVTQAIKAGHAQRHQVTGQVLRQWEWELSKGQLKHDSGLTKAKQDTARWSAAIQPQLLQLAAATPAGTSLGGLHAHVLALKATWDALWEEYLKPRWRRQRLALHHAQERVIEAFCKKVVNGMKWVSRHYYHQERGVAVFPGAGNFSQGGWKAGAVRAGFRKVVEQPSRPSADPRPDRLVIVDEFRTSRVSSSVHARQPCPPLFKDPPPSPSPGPVPPPQAPPGGRWLDRDTNGCLNLQRIGESRQRPIELCGWDDLEALPPIGKEYQQGYKLVNDRLPKGRQWLHRVAEYRRGIDGRARNNA
ncbi:hypothetical protein QJQ45_000846 [Haematococcus lacustris]|nr:hypothetical protein QJQ45_000846 [Haematococcus lacustris]